MENMEFNTQEDFTMQEPIPSFEGEVFTPEEPKGLKKLIRKWWFWVIVAAAVLTLIGVIVGVSAASNSGSGTYTPAMNRYVKIVKTTTNSNYGITYGAAFDSFFTNPRWEYFQASTGEHVVEFEGGFSYSNAPATAKIQFIVDEVGGTLEVYHLSIDGEAQSRLMLAAMVKKVFESY